MSQLCDAAGWATGRSSQRDGNNSTARAKEKVGRSKGRYSEPAVTIACRHAVVFRSVSRLPATTNHYCRQKNAV